MVTLAHRDLGYRYLSGHGLEIGALHEPAPVPTGAVVRYFDAMDENGARGLFPEIPAERFVHVNYVGDLDGWGLEQFADGVWDFVVINHVLEHLSNPVKTVEQVFRVVKPGGVAIIAIPDKEFTFDRHRALTSFEHLWGDYEAKTTVSDDSHYLDFLKSAAPHVFQESAENLAHHVARARSRREHTHVWNSASFRAFLAEARKRLGVRAECLFETFGAETQIEYFSAWRRL